MRLPKRSWRDRRGFVVSTELTVLAVVLAVGAMVGLVTFRDQLVQEFGDAAAALESLDQSFHIDGGASYTDETDASDPAGEEPMGLNVQMPSLSEGTSFNDAF